MIRIAIYLVLYLENQVYVHHLVHVCKKIQMCLVVIPVTLTKIDYNVKTYYYHFSCGAIEKNGSPMTPKLNQDCLCNCMYYTMRGPTN